MHGDDNVIYGAFGTSGLGDVSPIASATATVQPPAASEDTGALTPEDLQGFLAQIFGLLDDASRRLAAPGLDPQQVAAGLERLQQLRLLAGQVEENLELALASQEGYISSNADLNALGAQVVDFHEGLASYAPPLGEEQLPVASDLAPPQMQTQRRAFPWWGLALGGLSVVGMIWLLGKDGKASGLRGTPRIKGARPAR